MHRVLKKEQIITVPNLLSTVRLLFIPLIVWLYLGADDPGAAVAVIIISGLTDVADGIIARKCNMVSDFGKILDPIADKLTQAAIIICLTVRFSLMKLLIVEFVVREAVMAVIGYIALKKTDRVNSSKWHGKLTTVLLYAVLSVLILFPGIPITAANALILLCCAAILFSFIMYVNFYIKLFKTAGCENI